MSGTEKRPEEISGKNFGGARDVAAKRKKLALLGADVSDSESPQIHTFILSQLGFSCDYECVSAGADGVGEAVKRLLAEKDGFNVTVPYKKTVIPYLSGLSDTAKAFDSVNTVTAGRGYNTDGTGFLQMLVAAGIEPAGKRVLVLGAGGSGRSSAAALLSSGAQVWLYQRREELLKEVCRSLGANRAEDPEEGGYDLLVNCTGVGMHKTVGQSPVSVRAFSGCQAAVDLIYSPAESEFLRLARLAGKKTLNGHAMLFYQAYDADCLYLGRTPDWSEADELCRKYFLR